MTMPSVTAPPCDETRRKARPGAVGAAVLVLLALAPGCLDRGEVVGEINLGQPLVESETTLELVAGRKYAFIQDYERANTRTSTGDAADRRYCYQWHMRVDQNGQVQTLACEAFKGRNCVTRIRTSDQDVGADCMIDDCTFVAGKAGPARIRATLAELQPCSWTDGYPQEAQMQRLKVKVSRLSK